MPGSLWHRLKSHFDTVEKREQWGWCIYDWSNAAYVTSAAAVFSGPYVTSLAKQESCQNYTTECSWCDIASACISNINATMCIEGYKCEHNSGWCCSESGRVPVAGIDIGYGSFYAYVISAAVVVQVIMLPILAAMADYSGNTKKLFMITTYISASFVMLMFFVSGPSLWWLGGLFIFGSTIFFGAASVFYDSFLNMIAPVEERTALSSKGYGIGYAGGGLSLAINLAVYTSFQSNLTLRIMLACCGVWWVAFSSITFTFLREHKQQDEEHMSLLGEKKSRSACIEGMRQLWTSLQVIRRLPYTILFLVAAALYNDGIQTVMAMTSVFGSEALGLSSLQLGMTILMVQFVAFPGAIIFGFIARKIGDRNAVLITLIVWIISVTCIYFVHKYWEFMIIAFVVGLVLGGSQALSRAMFAKMVPKGYESQLFSFYQLSQRGMSWMGPMAYATRYNNNPRPGVLVLVVFLAVGTFLLWFVDVEKARQQAEKYSKIQISERLENSRQNDYKPFQSAPLVG